MQEQAETSRVKNGDATPMTKPEPAQVPSNNHNHPDNSDIKGKTAHSNDDSTENNDNSTEGKHPRDNSDDIGIIDNKANDIGTNDNRKFVHDPGGKDINIEDGSTCDIGDSTGSSTNDAPCAADTHRSYDRNRDKTSSSFPDVPTRDFVQAIPVPDVTSQHATDNPPTILPADAAQCLLSSQRLAHPFDFDCTRVSTPNLACALPSLRCDDKDTAD